MFTIQDMQKLPEKHPVKVTTFYPAFSTQGSDLPKPNRIVIDFQAEAPDLWEQLMTEEAEVGAHVMGTRQVTGSGSTDGRLFPVYAERLDAVNARREEIGLAPIY